MSVNFFRLKRQPAMTEDERITQGIHGFLRQHDKEFTEGLIREILRTGFSDHPNLQENPWRVYVQPTEHETSSSTANINGTTRGGIFTVTWDEAAEWDAYIND